MKIYTKTGDKGITSLIGGKRVSKAHLRIETYGIIDELNAYVGLLRDQQIDKHTQNQLIKIQHKLFTVGTLLAIDPENEKFKSVDSPYNHLSITDADIKLLENEMDFMDTKLPALQHFILPGGHQIVSICHICRTISRKAERSCVALAEDSEVSTTIIMYLNRLSDFFFVLARKLTYDLGSEEIKWNQY